VSPLLLLSILMRGIHLVAAAVWVGGSMIYLLVIIPALRVSGASPRTNAALGTLFRQVVNVCIGAALLSGVYLVFDRLSGTGASVLYVIVLVVKIVAALAMIALAALQAQEARRPASHRGRLWRLAPRWILGLGLLTFLLGAALVGLYGVV
jgi:uncharacterized membrane protein